MKNYWLQSLLLWGILMFTSGCHWLQRAAAAEREVERLKQQLLSANQNLAQAEQMQQAPDMEQALDILKSSSLEVELQAKEKEVDLLLAVGVVIEILHY